MTDRQGYRPAPAADPRVEQIRSLARLLDSSIPIPGTGRSIGIDPLLGLIPGFGDVAGAALSGYIILQALRLGVPGSLVARMVANVATETVVGTVPLVGDLFDMGWKANNRNVRLLHEHLEAPSRSRRRGKLWMAGVAAGVVLALVAVVAGGIWLGGALLRAVGVL